MNEKILLRVADIADVDHLVEFNYNMAFETENKKLDKELLKKGILNSIAQKTYIALGMKETCYNFFEEEP